MANVILRSNLTRVVSFFTDSKYQNSVDIIPGVNEISKGNFDALKEIPDFTRHMENQSFSVVASEGKSLSSLDELTAADAKKLVMETENTALLRKWLETTTRATVLSAIDLKLKAIKKERSQKVA